MVIMFTQPNSKNKIQLGELNEAYKKLRRTKVSKTSNAFNLADMKVLALKGCII